MTTCQRLAALDALLPTAPAARTTRARVLALLGAAGLAGTRGTNGNLLALETALGVGTVPAPLPALVATYDATTNLYTVPPAPTGGAYQFALLPAS